MPAKYTLVLRKDMRKGAAEGSKLFYANAKAAGTCGMYELCDLISLSSTASPGDVRLILDSLIEVMKRSLGTGGRTGEFPVAVRQYRYDDEKGVQPGADQKQTDCVPSRQDAARCDQQLFF